METEVFKNHVIDIHMQRKVHCAILNKNILLFLLSSNAVELHTTLPALCLTDSRIYGARNYETKLELIRGRVYNYRFRKFGTVRLKLFYIYIYIQVICF